MRDDIKKVLEVCMRINEEGKHTVMFGYKGHTNQLDVRLFIGGWVADANPTKEWTAVYLSKDNAETQVLRMLVELQEVFQCS